MTENEIKNAIRTINAKLEEALEREKETEGTEDTVIWHMVGNDYKCAIKALEEIQQYRAIGTVEECREARERQIPKKLIHGGLYACPNCHTVMLQGAFEAKGKCCKECGQVLDWSETV